MKSAEYRDTIRKMIMKHLRKSFPGAKQSLLKDIVSKSATDIHARLYGADVDNVASPLYRHVAGFSDRQPKQTVLEILEGAEDASAPDIAI